MEVIQSRFWLAAMRALYLDGERKKPHENISKKKILQKIIIELSKKAIYYLTPRCPRFLLNFSAQDGSFGTQCEIYHLLLEMK